MGKLKDYTHMRGKNNPNYKGGYSSGKDEFGFYNSWVNMKARCLNKNHPKYHRYGGRGIKICDSWLKIEGFAKWALSSGWSKGKTIDRINNDKDYCPENCHWVSHSDNSKKKSTTKLDHNDVREIRKMIVQNVSDMEISKKYGVCAATIWHIRVGKTHKEKF